MKEEKIILKYITLEKRKRNKTHKKCGIEYAIFDNMVFDTGFIDTNRKTMENLKNYSTNYIKSNINYILSHTCINFNIRNDDKFFNTYINFKSIKHILFDKKNKTLMIKDLHNNVILKFNKKGWKKIILFIKDSLIFVKYIMNL